MSDEDLPAWDNHGSPVSDPTALDIATVAIENVDDDEIYHSDEDCRLIAAAVFDAIREFIRDSPDTAHPTSARNISEVYHYIPVEPFFGDIGCSKEISDD